MITKTIPYKDKDTELEGYLAYEPSEDKKPAVIVAHDWSGRNSFACEKAEQLAKLGYVGFALDMFGNAKIGTTVEEKSELMQPFMENRKKLEERITVAFKTVQNLEMVYKNKIAVIGFCFGGLCALDLARSGADLKGCISFHGLLKAPPYPTSNIQAKVLALHGHDDPMVPPPEVAHFEKEMTDKKVDWQIHIYGNTKHAFTNPLAHDENLGTVFNTIAAKRSWQSMENFLTEIFG